MTAPADRSNPWEWMQPHDRQRFGDVIFDPAEQERWCRAVMLGGLPYMWDKAKVVRTLIFDQLRLTPGDKALIVGESVESCEFGAEIRSRVGETGSVEIVDITDDARDRYFAGIRGTGGQLATWRWEYTKNMRDVSFDAIAVLQATQHTDDWNIAATEFLRILKPGKRIAIAEISFSPATKMKKDLDLHIEYLFEKIFARIGFRYEDFPYYSAEQVAAAFAGRTTEAQTLEWKGLEAFWASKPMSP